MSPSCRAAGLSSLLHSIVRVEGEKLKLQRDRGLVAGAIEMAEPKKSTEDKALELAQEAVMVKSVPVAEGTPIVKGYDFNTGRDLDGIMAAAMTTGFQVPSPWDFVTPLAGSSGCVACGCLTTRIQRSTC